MQVIILLHSRLPVEPQLKANLHRTGIHMILTTTSHSIQWMSSPTEPQNDDTEGCLTHLLRASTGWVHPLQEVPAEYIQVRHLLTSLYTYTCVCVSTDYVFLTLLWAPPPPLSCLQLLLYYSPLPPPLPLPPPS